MKPHLIYIFIALALVLSVLCIVGTIGNNAMKECEKTHSTDVCYSILNR